MKNGVPIAIDLFSGAGGLTEGMKNAGFFVASAVEKDASAIKTYTENHPEIKLINADIKKLNVTDILKDTGIRKNAIDIIAGGPPCQGFSVSNIRTRDMKNPNNKLIFQFLRVIEEINPKWVVLENVAGLKLFNKGKLVDDLITYFKSINYEMKTIVLNAADFGVPQNRERIFFIGTRTNSSLKFIKNLERKNDQKYISVQEAISDLPYLENGNSIDIMPYKLPPQNEYQIKMRFKMNGLVSNNLVSRNSPLVLERYQYIKQGENWHAIMKNKPELMKNYKDPSRCHSGIYKRLFEEKPSIVISNYRKNMLIHPSQNRGLSVREAARIQSFPDKYQFKGPISHQQQQVANAVPPLLAENVMKEIIKKF